MEQFEILREAVAQVEQQLELDKITVEQAVFGLFFSGVKLSTGHGGLCFTPVKEMPEAVCCPSSARAMPLSGRLRGRPVQEYLDGAAARPSRPGVPGRYLRGEHPAADAGNCGTECLERGSVGAIPAPGL